ncbi:hypothetical protein KDX31_07460 [Amphritea atlantica]|uniref:UDP:flavonoid glycosyltransferase YjiC, YdhE family n=1 Tax=Amphritea atlantica TaxID=355243 RepID=A0ABY5GXS7_9GAMM|nr:hypothetical protein KDX31_07460 [Amphritea atlantica]
MRIAYLATADARGHLMRSQLLTHALQARGVSVQLITTSDEGQLFLAGFGLTATVLSRHYSVQFDMQQNMLRDATDANVAGYIFHPNRMVRDIFKLRHVLRENDLVLNDSFHPALLFMGCLPIWRHKVVHIYGASLRQALETNFDGRIPAIVARLYSRIIAFQINRARARLEHDFAYCPTAERVGNTIRIPTPVAVVKPGNIQSDQTPVHVAVYLNPHFCDAALAAALERGIADTGLTAHFVGEGMANRPGWVAQDADWATRAASSSLIISAPGMAALSIAQVYDRPIILVLTDQPEQQRNAARAKELGLRHRTVVWQGDSEMFAASIYAACEALYTDVEFAASDKADSRGYDMAVRRLEIWLDELVFPDSSGDS